MFGHHHHFHRHGAGRGGFRDRAFADDDAGRFAGPFGSRGAGRGGPGGPGGGGGRRRRLFDQGELQLLLLSILADQPRHGYDLIKEVEALSGGEYAPSPGIVYPALTFMEEQGVIAPETAEGTRKSYQATDDGRALLAEQAKPIEMLRERLAHLAQARAKTDPAPVRRAMHSMKTALFDRLSQENVSRETIFAIAEIIDEAARKIERIEP